MATSPIQKLIDAGVQFTDVSAKQAEKIVSQLVKAGDVRKRDAEEAIAELVDRGQETSEKLTALVQREVAKQVGWMSERFDDFEDQVEDLTERLRGTADAPAAWKGSETETSTPSQATKQASEDSTPSKKKPGQKSSSKKSPGKKSSKKKSSGTAKTSGKKKSSGTTKTSGKKKPSTTKKASAGPEAVGSSGVRRVATKRSDR